MKIMHTNQLDQIEGSMEGCDGPIIQTQRYRFNDIDTFELDDSGEFLYDDIIEAPIPPFDTRRRIFSTSNRPFRFICKLEIGSAICTGTLIAPNKVLTAAHCLSDHGVLARGSSIRVIPGKRASGTSRRAEPFGSAMGRRVHVPSGYRRGGDPFDYAVITLASNIGRRVGWWRRIAAWSDRRVLRRRANIAGFPGDKHPRGDHMYWTYNRFASVSGPSMQYLHDTAGGMSGAPIWIRLRNTRTIIGVHSGARTTVNAGVHITPTILQDIRRMIAI